MKRACCWAATAALAWAGTICAARAAAPRNDPSDKVRYEVTAALGKLVDAVNRGDKRTVLGMVSRSPEVSLISDGQIYTGREDIASHIEDLMDRREHYVLQLGTMAITDEHGAVLATGPYSLRRAGGDQSVRALGAVSFVMRKEGRGRWTIMHLHRSIAYRLD